MPASSARAHGGAGRNPIITYPDVKRMLRPSLTHARAPRYLLTRLPPRSIAVIALPMKRCARRRTSSPRCLTPLAKVVPRRHRAASSPRSFVQLHGVMCLSRRPAPAQHSAKWPALPIYEGTNPHPGDRRSFTPKLPCRS